MEQKEVELKQVKITPLTPIVHFVPVFAGTPSTFVDLDPARLDSSATVSLTAEGNG